MAASRTTLPTEDRDGQKRLIVTQEEIFGKFKVPYYEILDTLNEQITIRFQDLEKLYFIKLMDTSKFREYAQEFSTDALNNLKICYPDLFTDLQQLKNELQLIYNDEQYTGMSSENFRKSLNENNSIFKEAHKLMCLILTIPSTSVSVERSFSCPKRIKTYQKHDD